MEKRKKGVGNVGSPSYARKRVAAYIRVSTDQQADFGHSLEAQQERLRAYALTYDLEIVTFEADAGLSAATLERPALQRALAFLELGRAEGLLVTRLDRLTRSVRDFAELVHRFFGSGDYSLMSVTEQIDTTTPTGRLILNVLMSVSQWEREAAGERTSAVMARMKERGEYTGGGTPFGWVLGEEGALVMHMPEQAIIQRAKELRALGMSLRAVAGTLPMNPRNGKPFQPTQIARML